MAQNDEPGDLKNTQTGKGPLEEAELSVFPNPANTNITLQLSIPIDKGTVEVIDSQGRVWASGSITGTTTNVDVSALASGSYFIRVRTGEDMLISSVSISHP